MKLTTNDAEEKARMYCDAYILGFEFGKSFKKNNEANNELS